MKKMKRQFKKILNVNWRLTFSTHANEGSFTPPHNVHVHILTHIYTLIN